MFRFLLVAALIILIAINGCGWPAGDDIIAAGAVGGAAAAAGGGGGGHGGGSTLFITYPYIVGSCDTPGYAMGVYVSGSYAYIADTTSGLQVMNISNPTSPAIVGSCATPGGAENVFVSGSYAYVADYGSGLVVIKISE